MLANALAVAPEDVCLVPEKREEVTTEGGLDVLGHYADVCHYTETLQQAGIRVSIFIDPDRAQISKAFEAGARVIELHTGAYADAVHAAEREAELARIRGAAAFAAELGMVVNAGHGLNYHNVKPIAAIPQITELNIGHAIIGQAVFVGLDRAVRDMKALMQEARRAERMPTIISHAVAGTTLARWREPACCKPRAPMAEGIAAVCCRCHVA
jgi:pyridoxine 5-phosphate synthase